MAGKTYLRSHYTYILSHTAAQPHRGAGSGQRLDVGGDKKPAVRPITSRQDAAYGEEVRGNEVRQSQIGNGHPA